MSRWVLVESIFASLENFVSLQILSKPTKTVKMNKNVRKFCNLRSIRSDSKRDNRTNESFPKGSSWTPITTPETQFKNGPAREKTHTHAHRNACLYVWMYVYHTTRTLNTAGTNRQPPFPRSSNYAARKLASPFPKAAGSAHRLCPENRSAHLAHTLRANGRGKMAKGDEGRAKDSIKGKQDKHIKRPRSLYLHTDRADQHEKKEKLCFWVSAKCEEGSRWLEEGQKRRAARISEGLE